MYFKHYSGAFRAMVVQEFLKGEKSVAEIAFKYGVNPKRLLKWQTYFEPEITYSERQIDIQTANNE